MPGSSTTPGRSDLAMVRPKRVAFRARNSVGARGLAFAAPWLAYALPYRRFVGVLTDANARLGADVDRYTFIVVDLHHLLLAGLPAHSESYSLPTEPEGVIPSLIERFNSGKVSAMETLYEGAVLIADDGRTVTDRAEIAAELERDLSLGLPLEAKARHVFVNGDIALIVVDWSIDGTGPDGKHVHVEGTASDVARRGADGRWRYLIDNRLGTAVRQPA